MIKEYIYDWDELQNVCDDRGRLDPDEAAAYLACKEEGFSDIVTDNNGDAWSDEEDTIHFIRRKKLEETGDNLYDEIMFGPIEEAQELKYEYSGIVFSMELIKDLSPDSEIWILDVTYEWSIGRPTWRQFAKNLRLRIYIRIS